MEALVKCEAVCKSYKGRKALNNLNLTIGKGKIVGLLGPNGSGKTTLIKILSGILVKDSGEVSIDNKSLGIDTKKIVSYLPDRMHFDKNSKIDFLIQYYEDFYKDFRKERALEMLQNLNIDTKMRVKQLSKGNQEKVALILTMSREAKLYLLDEPIAGVDPAARDYILRTIISNYNEDATVVISTHLIADIEAVLSDVLFVKEGRIILSDEIDNVREREGKSIDQLFREVFRC